jgi:hypothetical protein
MRGAAWRQVAGRRPRVRSGLDDVGVDALAARLLVGGQADGASLSPGLRYWIGVPNRSLRSFCAAYGPSQPCVFGGAFTSASRVSGSAPTSDS